MKRLLVANRGEIAIRILSTARELKLHTIAIYTGNDRSHTSHAHEALQLSTAASFLDIDHLVTLCKKHKVDLVHPGYGFLSESPEFAEALQNAGITFVGPNPDTLRRTGDKLSARKLAEACNVPALPALTTPTDDSEQVVEFAQNVGYPVMIKAVDGGGGRGIRLVRSGKELNAAFQRAINESPSRSVFAEKAAIDGYRHVEVQILGDGHHVRHYWERECSIQRRYQKVVEIAPFCGESRDIIEQVIKSALRIAQEINYRSLGTWEFLVSPKTSEFYFMEINPRLQVEHTITETICGVDLVRYQLIIAQGNSLQDLSIEMPSPSAPPPALRAAQLRLTAEDPQHDFSLSIGRINAITVPGGNGIRVDTHARAGVIVSADFDSLLAKIIIYSSTDWQMLVDKCIRALEDTSVDGITTNIDLLRGIVRSTDFSTGGWDTQWLESSRQSIMETGSRTTSHMVDVGASSNSPNYDSSKNSTPAAISLKKGDAFDLELSGPGFEGGFKETLKVSRIFKNDFPTTLAAEFTSTEANSVNASQNSAYKFSIAQSSGMANSASGKQGDPKNPSHLICPLAGQLVEVLVDEGDVVEEWEPVAIIRQMKMELEVRAQKHGVVKSLWEVEEGDDVSSGMLVCEIVSEERLKEKL